MIKELLSIVMLAVMLSVVTDTSARPEYVAPTGAAGCTSCHNDNFGNGFKPGVLDALEEGGLAGLKNFLQAAGAVDTKPVIQPINAKWDITVGETAVIIPLFISDKENDSFVIHGSAPTGFSFSNVTIDSVSKLPAINFKWKPTADQAGKIYTASFYVLETGSGRTLSSNTVTAKIQVWPARVSSTKNVKQFMLQSAKWNDDRLTLVGQVFLKTGLSAVQRDNALATLRMNITSRKGNVISQPVKLTPLANGKWSKSLLLLEDGDVPCFVRLNYEGLKVERAVSFSSEEEGKECDDH